MNKELLLDFDIIFRSIVSIILLFIFTKFSGKKQLAHLTFFDYIAGISIGSIAAQFAVDDTIPFIHGVVALITYSIVPIIVSYISLKSIKRRKLLEDVPTILIQNGKLIEKSLKKSKFTVNDVLEECRLKNAFNISDIEYAILETNGKISVQLKAEKQNVTAEDLKIKKKYQGILASVIIDGVILYDNLKLMSRDEKWLTDKLKEQKIDSASGVLLATVDSNGDIYIDLKNNDPVVLNVLE